MTLDDGAYKTLTLLEVTGNAPVTATAKRSFPLLRRLVDAGYVRTYHVGEDAWMSITEAGKKALVDHRSAPRRGGEKGN
ncbi:hypothetical protein [Streptomyces albipurpureus]|uniref:MarR family transcriptional regulator n=1 Tax=Streptomyces albipurpureus TaxID=2897419 RepID=A0ABT0UUW8_9ACTN|nr:hypothetical protein [Streptomyces sp. CWNU-1]MCM2391764.1 hypothetical protein [Streptomyces sp. CWNU-1]